jgi:lipoprotein-releasing system ATP-binding protein
VTLVKHVSLELKRGEFVSITGPSGSGKSSLLYLLGLLDRPSSGRIWFEGKDTTQMSDDEITSLRLSKLGFIFQSHFLLPEFSALENVMLPMKRLAKLDEKEAERKAGEILSSLGLESHIHKLPKQMSGGQSQRVAVARALANDPVLILADEPTGNLDTASGRLVEEILENLSDKHSCTVVVVTHDVKFAERASRRIHIVDGEIT